MVRSLQASRSSLDKMSPAGSCSTLDRHHQHHHVQGGHLQAGHPQSRQRGLSHSPYGWKHNAARGHHHLGASAQHSHPLSTSEFEHGHDQHNPEPMIESPITPGPSGGGGGGALGQSLSLPPLYLEDGFQGNFWNSITKVKHLCVSCQS